MHESSPMFEEAAAGGGSGGNDVDGTKARLDVLKKSLAIAPEQEKDWQAYADAVTNLVSTRQALQSGVQESLPSYLERMEKLLESREKVLVSKKAVLQKYRLLYQSLSLTQQEVMSREGRF
ncbi:MAG: hypothetical protein HQL63_09585 [Magnetococcales bacterium]|nr:hypothetical protein [Magnetococcales bacterium]